MHVDEDGFDFNVLCMINQFHVLCTINELNYMLICMD